MHKVAVKFVYKWYKTHISSNEAIVYAPAFHKYSFASRSDLKHSLSKTLAMTDSEKPFACSTSGCSMVCIVFLRNSYLCIKECNSYVTL